MTHTVTVRHNFETAHRLPHLSGKCENLHGHSWWAEITVTAPVLAAGTVVEFGAFKRALREWIDTFLDHGAMLGANDPLAPVLAGQGSKLFRFGADDPTEQEQHAAGLQWPSVEAVAELLSRVAAEALRTLPRAAGAYVSHVRVAETAVNAAAWVVTA
ncbi:6-pyruvoyl trahydropterin synthase family protein [Kitasatospora cineracea]|uniref:6-carboxy-5,6,7,8-tetrahydropterin synthase n=1 Tax=Kitasatospora cineracea TaxID=88074 RepID=A0A8G1UFF9_9ACTN|nr:6-carboxytetrahydropterin synthase [Kitasatospora cineracea]ROR42930.1 6-pyruvoyltetrahydropterin/6-carboxytetrahydropterin synthase [Kitasatospora cineracea]